MQSQQPPLGSGVIILMVGAALGIAVAAYYYFVPLTGVNGTIGAGLVLFSTVAMLIAAALMPLFSSKAIYMTLGILCLLDVFLTALAGYFLHEWLLIAAMVIALVGVIRAISRFSVIHRHQGARV